MASRTRKRWCASGVLVRLTLTLSSLCVGHCADIGLTTTTTTTTTTTKASTAETTGTTVMTMTMPTGPRECIGGMRMMQAKDEVRLAVIAPGDPHHEQSLKRVLPAVLLAVKYISSPRGPLPGWNIKVDHRDSHCSSTYGPLAAFEFYINQTAGRTIRLYLPHLLSFCPFLYFHYLCFYFFIFLGHYSSSRRNRETRCSDRQRVRNFMLKESFESFFVLKVRYSLGHYNNYLKDFMRGSSRNWPDAAMFKNSW